MDETEGVQQDRDTFLNALQKVEGEGPILRPEQMDALPRLMGEMYLAHIRSCSFHLVKPVRRGPQISATLLQRWPVLVFEPAGSAVEEEEVEQRFLITGGITMRQDGGAGELVLGVKFEQETAVRTGWTAFVLVEQFPAVCVGLWRGTPLSPLGSLIGRLYRLYHAYLSFGYLQKLAVRLQYGDVPAEPTFPGATPNEPPPTDGVAVVGDLPGEPD